MSVPSYKGIAEGRASDLDARQRSLFAILDEAVEDAAKWDVDVYVIHAPIYVDEYKREDEACEHVYACKDGALCAYPKREAWVKAGLPWSIDAHVSPQGEVYLTNIPDILFVAGHTLANQRRVTVEVLS